MGAGSQVGPPPRATCRSGKSTVRGILGPLLRLVCAAPCFGDLLGCRVPPRPPRPPTWARQGAERMVSPHSRQGLALRQTGDATRAQLVLTGCAAAECSWGGGRRERGRWSASGGHRRWGRGWPAEEAAGAGMSRARQGSLGSPGPRGPGNISVLLSDSGLGRLCL